MPELHDMFGPLAPAECPATWRDRAATWLAESELLHDLAALASVAGVVWAAGLWLGAW